MSARPKPPRKPRRAPGKPRQRGSTAPRRPGMPSRGKTSAASFPWQWLAIGAGGVLLMAALFFGGRALFAPDPTPAPFLPTATPPGSTPTATLTTGVSPTATVTATVAPAAFVPPDIPALQQVMLDAINADRRANGLSEVVWDETAALAGTQHAKEMAGYGYLSHRNLDGYGPDYRYATAGGLHYVMENVYRKHAPGGGPTSAATWELWVREAQKSLMESAGHRRNILAPEHTHVGIGIAHDPDTGYFTVAQEFVNQYVTIQPIGHTAQLGEQVSLTGWLNVGVSDPILNLAYEPLPTSLSLEALVPETYSSPAETYATPAVQVTEDGQFTADFTLNNEDKPGLYHVRMWVDTEHGRVQALDLVIHVE